MKHGLDDLTTGSLSKKIMWFGLPLILSNLLQVLFNMADLAVVGQFAGAMALGSVGSTSILVMMFTGFVIGVSGGTNVLAALHYGAKSHRDLSETVHTGLILSVLMGVGLTVLGLLAAEGVLGMLNTKPELMEGALLYIRIYFLGLPALGIYNFGNAVFSAIGDTKRPLRYLALSGTINVILNLFFVIVCHMAEGGVALASVISMYISAALILGALFRSKEVYGLYLSQLRLTGDKVKEILRIGLPSGMQNAIFMIANLFIQKGVNSFDAVMVSGNSAAANADALIYDVMAAFYTACSSFMGQNLGARKKDRILKSYLISLAYSFGIGLILGVLLVIFGRGFLSLFTSEMPVIEAGMKRLVIMGFSYGISAFMDCTIAASRALGKSIVPTIIVLSGSCVFRIIWVNTVFAYFGTIPSLYLLYSFSWSITAIAEIIYFIGVYRKTAAALNESMAEENVI